MSLQLVTAVAQLASAAAIVPTLVLVGLQVAFRWVGRENKDAPK